MHELHFLKAALRSEDWWRSDSLEALASMSPPDLLFGRRSALLKGDAYREWARWFAYSFADPTFLALDPKVDYPHVFSRVFISAKEKLRHCLPSERTEISSTVASFLFEEVQYIRNLKKRVSLSMRQRQDLLDRSGSPPRCWITGWQFDSAAIDKFLGDGAGQPKLPLYVDVIRPIGINQRDISIEVDHVRPFAYGGHEGENLRLATGWANLRKRAYSSIYDVGAGGIRQFEMESRLGALPQPFWLVRMMGTSPKCEHGEGCARSVRDAVLSVDRINKEGAFVPGNLKIVCEDHVSDKENRFLPREKVGRIWKR